MRFDTHVLRESNTLSDYAIKHPLSQFPGERVLLTHVIRANQMKLIAQLYHRAVPKRRLRFSDDASVPPRQRKC